MHLSPRRTWAVVAGIEQYPKLPGWKLPGPARDAIDFTNWLLARGVPADQIKLCLSADDQAALTAQLASPVDVRGATREAVMSLLEQDVATWDGDLLILFWGGHGSIDSHDPKEPLRLYFDDASPESPACLSFDEVLRALRSKRSGYIGHQAFFVDACATFERRERFTMHATPVGPAVGVTQDASVRRFEFHAAGYGQAAVNDDAERTGLFSRELLRALRTWGDANPSGGTEWPPNFVAVADTVRTAFDDLFASGKTTQRPYLIAKDWDGSPLRGSGVSADFAERQHRLFRLRAAIEDLDLSTQELVALYRATIPLDPKLSTITDVEAIFESLSRRVAPAANWPPEAEFCERVRLYRAAHGGPWDKGRSDEWLNASKYCTVRELTDLLTKLGNEAEQDDGQGSMRYLVIELVPGPAEDAPRVEQAWLYHANRPHVQHAWPAHVLASDRTDIDRVRRIITDAAALGESALTIEFVTPGKHLGHAPRAWTLESNGIPDGDVCAAYPVAVRWRERLVEPHRVRRKEWKRAASRFQDAFRASGVSAIERLPAVIKDPGALWRKMEHGPFAELIWVGHVPLIFDPAHPLMCALLGGALAVCWSADAGEDEDRAVRLLEVLMMRQPADQLAGKLWEGRDSDDAELKEVCEKTVLFCDHLERNPYAVQLPSTT